jgi:hypothetical protein
MGSFVGCVCSFIIQVQYPQPEKIGGRSVVIGVTPVVVNCCRSPLSFLVSSLSYFSISL